MSTSQEYRRPRQAASAITQTPSNQGASSGAAFEPGSVSVIQNARPKEHEDAETLSLARSTSPSHHTVSQTSTQEYCQCPFEEFSLQVEELCELLWKVQPTLEDNNDSNSPAHRGIAGTAVPLGPKKFSFERMKGGGFNRVIGIDIADSNGESAEPRRLVLRVPRFLHARPDRDAAILGFVRKYTSIPVPEVVMHDFTKNNPLDSPYLVQARIPGNSLQTKPGPSYYPDLSHKQKCIVAKELGRILGEIQSVEHSSPGLIEAGIDRESGQDYIVRHLEIGTWRGIDAESDLNTKLPFFQSRIYVADPDTSEGPADQSTRFEQSTYYFFLVQFGRLRASELRRDPAMIGWWHYYERLAIMARQMDELGLLGDDRSCLCHLDLNMAPRNIMANVEPDESLTISGILDWDSAIFAPRFVGCVPPMWIWAWSDEEEDEVLANNTPSTPEQQELKQLFEDAVGPTFLEFAYRPEYRLARRLFQFAIDGMKTSEEVQEVESLLSEWATIYETYSVEHLSNETLSEGSVESTNIEGDEISKEPKDPQSASNFEGSQAGHELSGTSVEVV